MDFTKSKDIVADVRAATPEGLGAHAVILLAANEKPFQQAAEYVRSCGSVVAIGLPSGAFLKAPVLDTGDSQDQHQGKLCGQSPGWCGSGRLFQSGSDKRTVQEGSAEGSSPYL